MGKGSAIVLSEGERHFLTTAPMSGSGAMIGYTVVTLGVNVSERFWVSGYHVPLWDIVWVNSSVGTTADTTASKRYWGFPKA